MVKIERIKADQVIIKSRANDHLYTHVLRSLCIYDILLLSVDKVSWIVDDRMDVFDISTVTRFVV